MEDHVNNSAPADDFPQDELRILRDPDVIRELSDPLRRQVLDELTRTAQSGSQIARKLGLRPSKIHYAIRELERHGLIRLVGTRPIRGTTEKYFRAVARNFISDLRLGAVAAWDSTQLARYVGQPFLEQHRAEVLRVDARTLAHRIVVDHLCIKPGEIVCVNAISEAIELIEALVLEIQLAGAEEELRLQSPSIATGLYADMPVEHLDRRGRRQEFLGSQVDASIFVADSQLWSVDPPHDPERVKLIQKRSWDLLQRYQERGVRQLVVTPLLFRNLDWNSHEHLEFHDAYWRAALVSGDELHRRAEEMRQTFLRNPGVIIETGTGLRLSFAVDATRATISDGLCRISGQGIANLPAGELVLLVDTSTAQGRIRFDFTARAGTSILGVEMTIADGKIVDAAAENGQEDLERLLEAIPPGGDLISIFSLGLNPEIPADLSLATSDLFGTPIVDKARGIASIAFGTNRAFGGERDVPFFQSYSSLTPRVMAGTETILV